MSTPTDAELNALFAEKVAGWAYLEAKHASPDGWTAKVDAWVDKFGTFVELPDFYASADAVLPWLEQRGRALNVSYDDVTVTWSVEIIGFKTTWKAQATTFAKAAVLALLKAAGVLLDDPDAI